MNTIFAGTPVFAARCLQALLDSRHRVVGVLTQPDRPAGRGLVPAASPVKRLAELRGITVTTPENLRDTGFQQRLSRDRPDIMVVAAYGLILPRAVLDTPQRGAINVHASLLPRWRGAAPIQRALLAGDSETGISIMQMDESLDTGPVLLQESMPISVDDTAGTLQDRLAELGAKLAVQVLDMLEGNGLKPTPQSAQGVTYAPKFQKHEARIDWREAAVAVSRRVRAFNPSPGAVARLRGIDVKIWRCTVLSDRGNPGEILKADARGILVACGEGAILADALQRPGGKRLTADEFLRGFQLARGERFDV